MPLPKANLRILPENKSSALSLVELLVAVAVFSIVITVVTSVMWSGMRLIKRNREIAQKYAGARVALDFMARQIRSAFDFRFPGYNNFVWDPEKKYLASGVYTVMGCRFLLEALLRYIE